jgi:hypothetical protein
MRQSAGTVLMVTPVGFGSNPETAASNAFQTPGLSGPLVAARALEEFERFRAALEDAGVEVVLVEGRGEPHTPDQVFPNNWISLHADGTAVVYPMEAVSRRAERRAAAVLDLVRAVGFSIRRTVDLSVHEAAGEFLEGTGSLVFDHLTRRVHACRSTRTSERLARRLAAELGYEPFVFDATDAEGVPVYHTNVMMALGTGFAIVCAEAVADAGERRRLIDLAGAGGRDVILIGRDQMSRFAGNALELSSRAAERLVVLSATAAESLDATQRRRLGRAARPVVASVPTIESAGGGSVRCMLAEVFLPKEAADRERRQAAV